MSQDIKWPNHGCLVVTRTKDVEGDRLEPGVLAASSGMDPIPLIVKSTSRIFSWDSPSLHAISCELLHGSRAIRTVCGWPVFISDLRKIELTSDLDFTFPLFLFFSSSIGWLIVLVT
jgi:hypothetical protein